MGFVSTNPSVAAYFGPNIFAGTPFENAPVLDATIAVTQSTNSCSADITIGDTRIQVTMDQLGNIIRANRDIGEQSPFAQQTLERAAGTSTLTINGQPAAIVIPDAPDGAAPSAAFTPSGIYSR